MLVCCAPAERGHGYAAEMLAHVEEQARARGRDAAGRRGGLALRAAGPKGPARPTWRGPAARASSSALVDVQRRLPLPVPAERLDALAAEAAAHHEGYELRSFTGPVPDELVEGWAALDATLMTEAPMGDIEREAETADVAAVRAQEAMVEKQGRVKVSTVALLSRAGDGDWSPTPTSP